MSNEGNSIKALVGKIVADLREIAFQVHQKTDTEASHKEQDSRKNNQGRDVGVAPARVAVESFPTVVAEDITYKIKKRARERRSFHIGWLTLLFVGAYTLITGLQYLITKQSLQDNRKSLELLERQVQASIAASIQRQFTVGWPSNHVYLSVVLSDRGKTVATQVGGNFIVEKGKIQDGKFAGSILKSWKFSVPEIYPEPEMPPTRGVFLEISKEALTSYNGVGTALQVTGDLGYFDGFEVQHRSICEYVTGPIIFTNKSGQTQGGIGGGAVECDQIEMKLTDIKTNTDQYYK